MAPINTKYVLQNHETLESDNTLELLLNKIKGQNHVTLENDNTLELLLDKIKELEENIKPIKLHLVESDQNASGAVFNIINNPYDLNIKTGFFENDGGVMNSFFRENLKNIYEEEYMSPHIFRSIFKKIEYYSSPHINLLKPILDYHAFEKDINIVDGKYTDFKDCTYIHTGYILKTINCAFSHEYIGSLLFFKYNYSNECFKNPIKMFIFDENNNIVISNIDSDVILYDT